MRTSGTRVAAAVALALGAGGAAATMATAMRGAGQAPARGDWPAYAADAGSTHYSALDGIDRDNVARLEIAWEWTPGEDAMPDLGTRPGNFQNTPLMIDDVLYVSTPYNRVVALDAGTGRELWSFDPEAYQDGQPPNGTGFVHRGVAAWRGDEQLRILLASRYKLIALDGRTGEPIASFGDNGVVDLSKGLRWEFDRRHYTNTSPPVVYRDLVIVGNGVGDRLAYRNDPPGDVRAFDVRTGALVWSFHTVPGPGEIGHGTWGGDSWSFTGHTNVWAPMTLDEARGLVYLPVSTPSNDFYGGRRPGDNLFSESIVCLDAATGERVWHYQIVSHGLWDYDLPSAPILADITVDGRDVAAVVQLTKQGFAFVFDRVTGEPVWPIDDRPVPPSDVPGEMAALTQPFPTKPPALTPQGASLDDALSLTPALHAQARAAMGEYRLGPLYTPPSVRGTLTRPGIIGGANWGGGAFDPATGILYVKTSHQASVISIREPDRSASNPRAAEVDDAYVGAISGATFRPAGEGTEGGRGGRGGRGGGSLPLFDPPYGELVAVDLNRGEIVWRVPFGDSPALRRHPALAGIVLPDRLGAPGAPGVIVTAGGLVLGGGGDSALYAFDKTTGREVWKADLPRPATATPMTYRTSAGDQLVVMASGRGPEATLVAWKAGGSAGR